MQARQREQSCLNDERRQARGSRRAAGQQPPFDPDADYEDDAMLVFFDIDSMQVDGTDVANMLVAETSHISTPLRWYGSSCIEEFIRQLNAWASVDLMTMIVTTMRTRKVMRVIRVIAHIFQGYDSYPSSRPVTIRPVKSNRLRMVVKC